MRLPNGYGSVYKMGGKRRRPYAAVIVCGWDDDGKPQRKYLGYYPTKKDALTALANYNAKPYKIEDHGITLAALWERWKEYRAERGKSVPSGYKSAFKRLKPLHEHTFVDITTLQMQTIIDDCDKAPSARLIKVVMSLLYKYAAFLDITTENRAVPLETPTVQASTMHQPFTHDELMELWKNANDTAARFALLTCYTGMRPTELLIMKNDDVHMDERYMVGGIKTKNGIHRHIPIAKKILPIVQEMHEHGGTYLFVDADGKAIPNAKKFREAYWNVSTIPAIQNHLPHDGRHTCATALDNANVNRKTIQLILGHTSQEIGERVYTHKTTQQLVEAIDRLIL
ncbi:MAG: tyrosine-type recombinase/integrase [Selenomonas sp.]|uniref:tyrosine-type recombinase/integrase n=1 Tax=Selenomonas sp. TaxID=2053611 RepID=UPI0025D8A2A8|nr:tyrosine-type recombinase/integrase [Selenomonas sp.]MCI6232174.1 tyrosine-type recombinase/integrase [Selenomonas sp.]